MVTRGRFTSKFFFRSKFIFFSRVSFCGLFHDKITLFFNLNSKIFERNFFLSHDKMCTFDCGRVKTERGKDLVFIFEICLHVSSGHVT